MSESESFMDSYIHNACEIEFQKDLINFKQTEKIKHQMVKEKQHQINQIMDKKYQQLLTLSKIRRSTFINKMRMKVANIKYQLCQQIFSQVLKRLIKISQEKDLDYQLILINYIVEGCIQMFEQDIKIHVLEKDVDLIRMLKPDIMKSFQYFVEQEIGQQFKMKLIIAQKDCLKKRKSLQVMNKNEENQQAIGGVILSDITGNIIFKNTFDARLNILKEICLPMIRQMLWPVQNQLQKIKRKSKEISPTKN